MTGRDLVASAREARRRPSLPSSDRSLRLVLEHRSGRPRRPSPALSWPRLRLPVAIGCPVRLPDRVSCARKQPRVDADDVLGYKWQRRLLDPPLVRRKRGVGGIRLWRPQPSGAARLLDSGPLSLCAGVPS